MNEDSNFLMRFEVMYTRNNAFPKFTLRKGEREVTLTKEFIAGGNRVNTAVNFSDPDKFVKYLHQNILTGKYSLRGVTYVKKNGTISQASRAMPTDKVIRSIVRSAV